MNKSAALFMAGLVLAVILTAHSQEKAGPAAAASEQIDLRNYRPGRDFVTLNFTNIDISTLVKVMSEMTSRNFILDERVTGKVTVMTPTKITPGEAYQVFLTALEMKGFTVVEDGKVIRIIPLGLARQSGLKVFPDGRMEGEGFVTKLIRMSSVNPQDMAKILSPLIGKDGNLIAYPASNSLIVTDSVHNIRKLESLIRTLDVPAPEGRGKINVYYLRYANAEDIAKVMSSLMNRLPAATAGPQAQQSASTAALLENMVTITADKTTNALIIVGSPGDYEMIKDVIQKLDIRRRQVYVEAAIIEISLAKQHEFGLEFQAYNQNNNSVSAIGGTNFGNIGSVITNGLSALSELNGLTVGAVKGTFTYNGTEYLNMGALLHALQSNSDVNVLSTPNLLTMDNQKAEILVGQNVPFKTGQTQNATTGSQSIYSTIERKDVGIKLSITPQISSDENVLLDISQEISDVVESTASSSDGLITNKRSANTTVVVKDHETMIIGGLIRDNVTLAESKVPLLGDIPLFGWLFRYRTKKVEKVNLMIFITPYIIKNESDAGEITKQKSDALERMRYEHHFPKNDKSDIIESR